MNIKIHFIRHGESQANVIQKFARPFHTCIMDPRLTKKGIQCTKQTVMPDVDIVCCSTLLRAKETARLNFPESHIYVLPCIKELGIGLDNMPKKFTKQYDSFENLSKFIHVPKDSNCKNFLDYLQKFSKSKDSLTVALFTHKRFIAKHTDEKNAKNNQIVTKIYEL